MEKLSPVQVAMLLTGFLLGTAIVLVPVMEASQHDSWLALFLAGMPGFLMLSWLLWLAKRYPCLDLVEISHIALGRLGGKLLGGLWLSFFLMLTLLVARNTVDFFHIFFVRSPVGAFVVPLLLLSIYAVKLGREVIGRFAELLVPGAVLLFLLMTIMIIPEIDMRQFQPVLLEGIRPIIWGAFVAYSFPVGMIIMLLPFITRVGSASCRIRAYMYVGLLTSMFILGLRSLVAVGVLGPQEAAVQLIPVYSAFRQIVVFDVIQRIDFFMFAIFGVTSAIMLFVCFYTTNVAIAALFGLPDYRVLTLPLGVLLIFLVEGGIGSVFELLIFKERIWPIVSSVFVVFLPLLLTGALLLRGRRTATGGKNEDGTRG